LKSFPKYLIVQLTNFALNGWVPKKLHCNVQMGDLSQIHLEKLKAPKIPEGTPVLTPGDGGMDEEPIPTFDEEALGNLLSMGFSENRCKRALMETGNNAENALNHIMSTLDDMSQDAPIEPKKKGGSMNQGSSSIEKLVEQVWPMAEGMGIDKKLVYAAAEVRVGHSLLISPIQMILLATFSSTRMSCSRLLHRKKMQQRLSMIRLFLKTFSLMSILISRLSVLLSIWADQFMSVTTLRMLSTVMVGCTSTTTKLPRARTLRLGSLTSAS
jgi:hypothetical protein